MDYFTLLKSLTDLLETGPKLVIPVLSCAIWDLRGGDFFTPFTSDEFVRLTQAVANRLLKL